MTDRAKQLLHRLREIQLSDGVTAKYLEELAEPATGLETAVRDGPRVTREAIDYFSNCYLSSPQDGADWRASPALAPSFHRLPPAFVLTAGYDPLRDEGAQYAQRLRDAGVAVEYVCFDAQIHGFITMSKVVDAAAVAFDRCAGALKRAFFATT